ncbi:hypothetical protein NMG60_11006521 [Bertholletia excelsa]
MPPDFDTVKLVGDTFSVVDAEDRGSNIPNGVGLETRRLGGAVGAEVSLDGAVGLAVSWSAVEGVFVEFDLDVGVHGADDFADAALQVSSEVVEEELLEHGEDDHGGGDGHGEANLVCPSLSPLWAHERQGILHLRLLRVGRKTMRD